MQATGQFPILPIRTDEAGDGNGGAVGEEPGHFGDAPDVLVAVAFAEAEVLVEAEADVVAVEPVGGQVEVQQVLLQCGRDGRFARAAEAGEPDCVAGLVPEQGALGVGEGGVPGYVSACGKGRVSGDVWMGERRCRRRGRRRFVASVSRDGEKWECCRGCGGMIDLVGQIALRG